MSPEHFWEWNTIENYFEMASHGMVIFQLKITSCVCFKGSGLKLIFHWKTQLFVFKLLLRLLVPIFWRDICDLTVEKCDMKSVHNLDYTEDSG